jgi:hypothetical protein
MVRSKLIHSFFRYTTRHPRQACTALTGGLRGLKLWLSSLSILLLGSQAFAGQVSLQWDAVNNAQLTGYKVYYGYASRQYNTNVNVGMSTTAAFSDLKNVQVYYFAVTAFDSAGTESSYSNEVSYDLASIDSDKDTLSDWDEINTYRTDPDRTDTDGDGLSDGDEVKIHATDPAKADSDSDGVSDGIEVSKSSNPLDPNSFPRSKPDVIAVNSPRVERRPRRGGVVVDGRNRRRSELPRADEKRRHPLDEMPHDVAVHPPLARTRRVPLVGGHFTHTRRERVCHFAVAMRDLAHGADCTPKR